MKKRLKVISPESGQVLVLIVLAIVGLFGFAALALDGGMLLLERRRAQNAADASVLAAALAKIQGTNPFTIALQRAASNGYETVEGMCNPNWIGCIEGIGEQWTVQVSIPPLNGDYGGNSNYIQVRITSEVETAFAHLVFSGPLQTTIEAVSRVRPEGRLAAGNALYAAAEHACPGIWFTGTGDTEITDGNVFSNSDGNGDKNCYSGDQDGAGYVNVTGSVEGMCGQQEGACEIQVVGAFDQGGSGSVTPGPHEGVPHDNLRVVPRPDCSGLGANKGAVHINAGDVVTLNPGNYESITFSTPNSVVKLTPGMYCIHGEKGFSGNGGKVIVDGTLPPEGHGVMIYLKKGPFDLGGNTDIFLFAEPNEDNKSLKDASGNEWKGMLIYVDPDNKSDVKITGTSGSEYTGTIFAPSSDCVIQGTGDSIGLSSQVICYTVKVAGTAFVDITYVEGEGYVIPAAIDLVQ
jgi:hypothetical protein